MDDFLNALVALLPAPLRGAGQAIVNRLLAIWHAVVDFWTRVAGGWARLVDADFTLGLAQLRHLYALAVTLRWFATTYIPRQAALFANAVRTEARQLFDQAVTGARAELAQWRNFFADKLAGAVDTLRQWAAWALGEVTALRDRARRIEDHLFGNLGTPAGLASWAIGAIIDAAIGWFEDNAVRIGRRLVAQRTQIFLSGLDKAEDIISRIL